MIIVALIIIFNLLIVMYTKLAKTLSRGKIYKDSVDCRDFL